MSQFTERTDLIGLPIVVTDLPELGQPWPGVDGIYAGVARGVDGDHHVVLLKDKPATDLFWQAGLDWARGLEADMPTRDESALLYANLRDQFDAIKWHWTSTQYSEGEAWYQYFGNGGQDTDYKEFEAACRAVRRFPLQSFNPSASAAPVVAELRNVLSFIDEAVASGILDAGEIAEQFKDARALVGSVA